MATFDQIKKEAKRLKVGEQNPYTDSESDRTDLLELQNWLNNELKPKRFNVTCIGSNYDRFFVQREE